MITSCESNSSMPEDCSGLEGGNTLVDCAGVCGGSSELDSCGVCMGDGSTCDTNCVPDCSGNMDGSSIEDACGVCNGNGTSCNGRIAIYYDFDTPIAGFQFKLENIVTNNAFDGAAANAGLSVSTNSSSSVILGFSFSGSIIPCATNNVLTFIDIEGTASNACITEPIISDINGVSLPVEIIDCLTIKEEVSSISSQ